MVSSPVAAVAAVAAVIAEPQYPIHAEEKQGLQRYSELRGGESRVRRRGSTPLGVRISLHSGHFSSAKLAVQRPAGPQAGRCRGAGSRSRPSRELPLPPFWVRLARTTSVSVRVRAASCLVGGGSLPGPREDRGRLVRRVSVRRSTLLTLGLLVLVLL